MHTKTPFSCLSGLLIALFVITGLPSLSAQSLPERVTRKVTRRAERKVERTIDNAVDEALEGIFNRRDKPQRTETEGDSTNVEVTPTESGGIRVTNPDDEVEVTIEEDTNPSEALPSTFTGYFTMEVTESKNGKPKKDYPMSVTYHIDTYKFAFITADPEKNTQMTVIVDRQARKMTNKMDNDGERTATVLPMPRIKVGVRNQSVEEGTYTVSETGRTKNILGYDCREYRVETEAEVTLAWVAEAFNPDLQRSFDFVEVNGNRGGMTHYNNLYKLQGMVLEAHTEIKGKNETRDMFITDLVPGLVKPEVYSLDGFQVSDVTNMFGN
ncbi:MAG: DUF4412 domain-containing protein [Bacteroidetes bacterium]|nr:MAG: DUF4412 domain-containing protein [Bacteroidota bacterium]